MRRMIPGSPEYRGQVEQPEPWSVERCAELLADWRERFALWQNYCDQYGVVSPEAINASQQLHEAFLGLLAQLDAATQSPFRSDEQRQRLAAIGAESRTMIDQLVATYRSVEAPVSSKMALPLSAEYQMTSEEEV